MGVSSPEKVNYVPHYYYPSVKSATTDSYMPSNYLDQSNYEQVIVEPQEQVQQHLTQLQPQPQQYHHQQTGQAAKKHVKSTHHVKN